MDELRIDQTAFNEPALNPQLSYGLPMVVNHVLFYVHVMWKWIRYGVMGQCVLGFVLFLSAPHCYKVVTDESCLEALKMLKVFILNQTMS